MPTAENCRARADEADRLASVVSYGRDKLRLKEQAAFWRTRAAELESKMAAVPPPAAAPAAKGGGRLGWLRRRFG